MEKSILERARPAVIGLLLLTTASCSSFIQMETPNRNDRVRTVVIHFTAESEAKTLDRFMDSDAQVSAHFVVTEEKIYQMADLGSRTYHAGISFWRGRHSLNDTSIGIELVQEIDCIEPNNTNGVFPRQSCAYPDYSPGLIINTIKVLENIYATYPNIGPVDIVGHQDVSPMRKSDPGPRFPWQYLNQAGYGAWYDSADYLNEYRRLEDQKLDQNLFIKALYRYGYQKVTPSESMYLISAFQTHFTPELVTGKVTRESMAAILALLKKYFPEEYMEISNSLYAMEGEANKTIVMQAYRMHSF
ncbi:MAG: N-acetylmuramoyl-L-alanine amidase [Vibrio ordalii]|uniref:N-acetylmuramoyl-L-alanine amidase n=1 Tax=Vibrio ordalii TaxID=28174 RepID=UPI003F339693